MGMTKPTVNEIIAAMSEQLASEAERQGVQAVFCVETEDHQGTAAYGYTSLEFRLDAIYALWNDITMEDKRRIITPFINAIMESMGGKAIPVSPGIFKPGNN